MTSPEPQGNAPVQEPQAQATATATPPALSAEPQRLYDYFKIVDPEQKGVGLDQVRPIYPAIGWNIILGHCGELEARNMLTKEFIPGPRGRGGFNKYKWQ